MAFVCCDMFFCKRLLFYITNLFAKTNGRGVCMRIYDYGKRCNFYIKRRRIFVFAPKGSRKTRFSRCGIICCGLRNFTRGVQFVRYVFNGGEYARKSYFSGDFGGERYNYLFYIEIYIPRKINRNAECGVYFRHNSRNFI